MHLSFLLLFAWLAILIVSLFSSAGHVLKSAVAAFLSAGLVCLYIYAEKVFSALTSFRAMTDYFYYLLKFNFDARGLSSEEGYMVASAIYIFIIFIVGYFIFYFIFSLFPFGGAPAGIRRQTWAHIAASVLHFAVWGFAAAFFISRLSPYFQMPYGFLSKLITTLQWSFI